MKIVILLFLIIVGIFPAFLKSDLNQIITEFFRYRCSLLGYDGVFVNTYDVSCKKNNNFLLVFFQNISLFCESLCSIHIFIFTKKTPALEKKPATDFRLPESYHQSHKRYANQTFCLILIKGAKRKYAFVNIGYEQNFCRSKMSFKIYSIAFAR